MRRLLIVFAVVLVPASAARAEPAAWQVVNVGQDLDTLDLTWEGLGCGSPARDLTVVETDRTIRIRAEKPPIDPASSFFCYVDPFALRPFAAHLRHRLGGRRIVGGPRLRETSYHPRVGESDGVPRVIDL